LRFRAFFPRPSPLASSRRGITLLEVMIAVMVLGIGLIGVGALVSVGALQAQRANVDDHKAILGQAVVREDRARGMLHAESWLTTGGSYYMTTSNGSTTFPTASAVGQPNLQPVAIDPLMVAAFGNTVTTFASGGQATMPRLTIGSLGSGVSLSTTSAGTAFSSPAAQACVSEDDMKFTISTTNDDLLPTGGYNSISTKREFIGQYSWMLTLVPVYGDWQPTENRNLMTMSVVVFNQRQFAQSPYTAAAPNPPTERACQVTAVGGSGYGGGDITLSGSSSAALNLRVGECLMLGWMQKDVPADSNGKITTFSPSATYGTLTRPMFRWYRILNAGPQAGSGSSWTRNVTVAGTDLNLPLVSSGSMYAFIYDGACAVYERTVRLEGPSLWTN
jgi:prepilin-type N-terminal cleavage/methylation domain-containing protein